MSAIHDLDTIAKHLGQPLDCTIYAEGKPIALAGSLISSELVDQLRNCDPHLLSFEHGVNGSYAESRVPPVSAELLAANADRLRTSAGISPIATGAFLSEAMDKMHIVYDTCRYLGRVEVGKVAEVAELLSRSVKPASRACLNASPVLELESYDYSHAVNCCCLAMAVFSDFVDSQHDLLDAAVGLLLHDIGKSKIDERLLQKKERLTAADEQLLARHVLYGYNLVRNHAGVPTVAKELVLNHHERCNGTGYLRGLREAELSQWDLIAAVVDVYDAMTSSRSYRTALDPHRAVSQLVQDSGALFSSRIVHYFVRSVGRFPVGTFVVLNNGETAVVTEANPGMLALPRVCVLFDADGAELDEQRSLDLAADGSGLYIDFPVDLLAPATAPELSAS